MLSGYQQGKTGRAFIVGMIRSLLDSIAELYMAPA